MRDRNTGEPRTDLSPPGGLLLASAASLLLLAAGCGGAGAKAQSVWENTKKTVSDTLVSISKYQREGARERRGAGKPGAGEAKAAARPFQEPLPSRKRPPRNAAQAGYAPIEDRFPSRGRSSREEDLGAGNARGAGGRAARGEGSREALLPPGALMDAGELRRRIQEVKREEGRARRASARRRLARERGRLERMLRRAQREEEIIREMERLRERLRALQKDLLEVQRAGR